MRNRQCLRGFARFAHFCKDCPWWPELLL